MAQKVKKIVLAVFICFISFVVFAQVAQQKDPDVIYPKPFETRNENLDFIFSNDEMSFITLQFTGSEWNTLLEYYDMNPKNETCIHGDFIFTKGNYTWEIKDVGVRLRGNTSRVRPENVNKAGKHEYLQAHFKVDFEEWISDDEPERRLADCIKGLNLKRFKDDPTYVREVYGYDLFRKNGIWTAPRAGYTNVTIIIIDMDENGTKKSTEVLNYGVYSMIEEINKQFLKARTTSEKGGNLTSNKGDLWKCLWPAPLMPKVGNFGVEEVSLKEVESQRFSYDLKTNKEKLNSSADSFKVFMEELNSLKTDTPENIAITKKWYEEKMDVDLFIKTYAINVLLGMWDDYWNNQNNYYLYFDNKGKVYFIPYDYDNILGVSIDKMDSGTQNPLKWGIFEVGKRPLMEKLLGVPEFNGKYRQYLLELSNEDSFFTYSASIDRIKKWQTMVTPYIFSKNLTYKDTYKKIADFPAEWGTTGKYRLLSNSAKTNFFKVKAATIQKYCGE